MRLLSIPWFFASGSWHY